MARLASGCRSVCRFSRTFGLLDFRRDAVRQVRMPLRPAAQRRSAFAEVISGHRVFVLVQVPAPILGADFILDPSRSAVRPVTGGYSRGFASSQPRTSTSAPSAVARAQSSLTRLVACVAQAEPFLAQARFFALGVQTCARATAPHDEVKFRRCEDVSIAEFFRRLEEQKGAQLTPWDGKPRRFKNELRIACPTRRRQA